MMIYVTRNDIAEGDRDSCLSCPVALAVSRAFGQPQVWCSNYGVTVGGQSASLPSRIAEWIRRFDEGKTVTPTRFALRLT